MVNFVNLGEIYGRLDNARANDVNIAGARQQQEIGQYKLSQAQRADEEAMAIRDIYKSTGGDLNLTQKKLSELGYFDQANAVGKQITESKTAQAGLEKGQLENAEKRLNLVGQGMGFVLQNPTKQNAVRVLENLKNMGALNDEQYQAYVGNMPDDPALVKQGAETLIRMALDAKDQLPQFKSQDIGGKIIDRTVNPVTAEVANVGEINKTMTPDQVNDNATKPFYIDESGKLVPNTQVQNYELNKASRGAANVSVNTGQKGFDNTLKLRGDFRSEPIYKAHQDVKSAYSQISAALKQASPAGDLAGATKIMKILDPGSVVRESELGMAMAANGMLDRITNYAQMTINGTKLTPNQRKDFQKLADTLYQESINQYNSKRNEYKDIAARNELNEADVVGSPDAIQTERTFKVLGKE